MRFQTQLDHHDVVNLLIKSQLQRTQHLTSPYKTPQKEYLTNLSPYRYVQPTTPTYSRSPQPQFKYTQPNPKRSPNYFKNKYQGFETKYETTPSVLMQLLQPVQPQVPQAITEHMKISTIKEFQDFLSQQIHKHVLLNNMQYNAQSKNHYISTALHPPQLSEQVRSDESLKKSVCVMLNHYLQFLITIIDSLSNQITSTPKEFLKTEPNNSDSAVSFKAVTKTEPNDESHQLQDRQAKAQQYAQQVGKNQDNPMKFKSLGLQKKAHDMRQESPTDDEHLNQQTPRIVPFGEEKIDTSKMNLDQSAKKFANDFLSLIFDQGNQRADRIIKSQHQSKNDMLNITLSNHSKIQHISNHSFNGDPHNEGFLDDDDFDPKTKERINIPSDDEN